MTRVPTWRPSSNQRMHVLVAKHELKNDEQFIKPSDPVKVDAIRLPTEDMGMGVDMDMETTCANTSRTNLHIYHEQGCTHKLITRTVSPSQERRWGPTLKEQKARRLAKRQRLIPEPDENAFFLHSPYLSFHLPPSVLYAGGSKHAPAKPVALIHTGCFWKSYKIQLGPSLALPGVIDPRGVVSWRHNGGSKAALKDDETAAGGKKLRGYRVRGWRLWGETGKAYVHSIRDQRKAGVVFDDPDVDVVGEAGRDKEKIKVDEVVDLKWTTPLSRHTRRYSFFFRGIEFQWKGTGTVNESRKCGWMLRFCHLKLVARVPVNVDGKEQEGMREVCLGKYTSSIAAEKGGTLEVFDEAVLNFVEEYIPSLLQAGLSEKDSECQEREAVERCDTIEEDRNETIAHLKKGVLYQLVVATVLCMANAEKEKRHTLIDFIIGVAENGGNGGG